MENNTAFRRNSSYLDNDTVYFNMNNTTMQHANNTVITEINKWIAVTILFWIIVLNCSIFILLYARKKHSRMAFFVKNLAIADLSVGLVYLFPEILIQRFHVGWRDETCYIFLGLKMLPIYCSTFAIVILTLDRMYVIVRPLTSATRGVKYRFGLAGSTWLLSGLLSIPYLTHVTFTSTGKCIYTFTNVKAMVMSDVIINLIIPVIIMGVCYIVIISAIMRRQRNTFLVQNVQTLWQKTEKGAPDKQLITRAKIRTIKLLLIVVIAYIVCWTPTCVGVSLNVWKVIDIGPVFQMLFVLAPLNSAMNPLVFLLFNRKMFKKRQKTTFNLRTLNRAFSSTNHSTRTLLSRIDR